jgi:tetratricopeptide (TPR) repeat protein
MANICALVRQGEDEQANAATDKLIKDFEGDAGLPEVVYRIGQQFEWSKGETASGSVQYNASANIYRRLLESSGQTSYGKMADRDYRRLLHRMNVLSLIEKGDYAGAEAAVDKMVSELAGKPELPDELSWMAAWCNDHHKYNVVDKLDKRIMTEFPNSTASIQSLWRIANIIIGADEDANRSVDDTIGQLKKRFADTPNLLPALITAGKIYQQKAETEGLPEADKKPYLEKAVRLFTEVIQTAECLNTTPGTYLQLADCYRKLHRFSDALSCYEKIKGKWPDSLLEKECLMGIQMCNIELHKEKENDYVK